MKNRYEMFNNRTKVDLSNFYPYFVLPCVILGINGRPLLEKIQLWEPCYAKVEHSALAD